jgi:competence protein ComGC
MMMMMMIIIIIIIIIIPRSITQTGLESYRINNLGSGTKQFSIAVTP